MRWGDVKVAKEKARQVAERLRLSNAAKIGETGVNETFSSYKMPAEPSADSVFSSVLLPSRHIQLLLLQLLSLQLVQNSPGSPIQYSFDDLK
jgi:hypothetical protein